jgi:hypothetical protein
MALATETKTFSAYSPTSTPILDVVRPAPHARAGKVTAGEYFFLSSLLMAALIALPGLRTALVLAGPAASANWLLFVLSPVISLMAAFLVHETGHLLGAWSAGFRFTGLEQEYFHLAGVLRVVRLNPRKTDHLRGRLLVLHAGGPLAGLIFAAVLELSRDWTQSGTLIQFRVHLMSAFSLLLSLAALLPDTSRGGNFSDGARFVMLLKDDERAARWFAILEMQLALEKGTHPREWDSSLILRATSITDDSRDAVAAHWLAYLWAYERQDITSATRYLEEALTAPARCSAGLRDRLFLEAAVFQAWFRDNPAKARSWAELIRRSRLTRLEQQRLEIAMLWANGRLFDSLEKLSTLIQVLGRMPASSSRDLAEKSALEWKHQMESRMLTRAWRAMYTLSQQVDSSALEKNGSASKAQLSSC